MDSASDPAAGRSITRGLLRGDVAPSVPELAEMFREGRVPSPPPDGEYDGSVLAFDLGPLTGAARALAETWVPWRGKRFDAARGVGSNLLTRDSLPVVRLLWPTYGGVEHLPRTVYRAFEFATELRPSLLDPGRRVLAIDYDLSRNPRLGVRQFLDELVEVEPGVYLGQAIMRLRVPGGPPLPHRVAYFSLFGPAMA